MQDRGEPPGAVARPTSREARVSCAASRPGRLDGTIQAPRNGCATPRL